MHRARIAPIAIEKIGTQLDARQENNGLTPSVLLA